MAATTLRFDAAHSERRDRQPQRKPVKRTVYRLKGQKPPRCVGVCRVGLFEADGRLVKFYARPFDTNDREDRRVLAKAFRVWGAIDLGNAYLGLVAANLKVIQEEV